MSRPGRRGFLKTPLGLALASRPGLAEKSVDAGEATEIPPLKIIDAHIHVVDPRLPGVPLKSGPAPEYVPFDEQDKTRVARAIRDEMAAAGITQALCMPRFDNGPDDPLGVNETLMVAALVPGLHTIGIADPTRTHKGHFDRVRQVLDEGKVKAFKGYLGYLHHGPESPNYRPYYEIAADYDIPVVFHTGDTYSHMAKVKYAHPLRVDEVAVDHPRTKFVLAHVGNPWTIDAAEVLYKNNKAERANVWTDLSGLLVGTLEQFQAYEKAGVTDKVVARIRDAFVYAERPDRFLFGTDWPLAPFAPYRDFVRKIIPAEYHQAVFHDNARDLFRL